MEVIWLEVCKRNVTQKRFKNVTELRFRCGTETRFGERFRAQTFCDYNWKLDGTETSGRIMISLIFFRKEKCKLISDFVQRFAKENNVTEPKCGVIVRMSPNFDCASRFARGSSDVQPDGRIHIQAIRHLNIR